MFSIPVFIINRESETERLSNCKKHLEPYFNDIRVFKATEKDYARENAHFFFKYEVWKNVENFMTDENIIPNWSAGACAMSHFFLWDHVVNTNQPYVMIVEDDFEVVDANKFKFKLGEMIRLFRCNISNNFLKNGKKAQMICQMDGIEFISPYPNNHFAQRYLKVKNFTKPLSDYVSIIRGKTINTHCYIINREACQYLVNYILPIKYQIDVELSNIASFKFDDIDYVHLNCEGAGTQQSTKFPSQIQHKVYTIDELNGVLSEKIPEHCIFKVYGYLQKSFHYYKKMSYNPAPYYYNPSYYYYYNPGVHYANA
jgi:GR25 family glycosyltransferase involved in LPS biosynthesis